MHINDTYNGLLADVADLTRFSEIRGSGFWSLQWGLNIGPKLEKMVLAHLESGSSDASWISKEFPEPLRRLAYGALVDPLLLRYLRQLLLFSYKALVPHDHQTVNRSIQNYLDTNRLVGEDGNRHSCQSPRLLHQVSRHIQSVLYRVRYQDIIPGHGPGAVTTCKVRWSMPFGQIDRIWPLSDYMTLYQNQDHCAELGLPDDSLEIVCKLTAVPKDARGPRLICVHPAEAMWFQQGLRRVLERAICSRRHGAMQPGGRIVFDDQTNNGRIALISSRSRKYATIDMKEASDRLSDVLIQRLFGRYYKYFGCCRAQKVSVNGVLHDIHAYAPMGNATVFPVQSLVFWAICVSALQDAGCKTPNSAFVFGDDIVVPSRYYKRVFEALESFGLVVNTLKSFHAGYFRESCGVEAFNGVDVTPVRWKTAPQLQSPTDLLAACNLAMRLALKGYSSSSANVYRSVRTLLRAQGLELFFSNNPDHGSIAEFTPMASLAFQNASWRTGLQWWYSPVYRLKSSVINESHGWNHVLESILSLERTGRGLDRSASVSRRIVLKRDWTPIV